MNRFVDICGAMLLATLLACVQPRSSSDGGLAAAAALSPTERVVQAQVEAYNRRDLEDFLRHFAPDARLYAFPDSLLFAGLDTLRTVYGNLFARATGLRAEINNRTLQGQYVIDQETTHGISSQGPLTGVAIYEVRGGLITRVWFLD